MVFPRMRCGSGVMGHRLSVCDGSPSFKPCYNRLKNNENTYTRIRQLRSSDGFDDLCDLHSHPELGFRTDTRSVRFRRHGNHREQGETLDAARDRVHDRDGGRGLQARQARREQSLIGLGTRMGVVA